MKSLLLHSVSKHLIELALTLSTCLAPEYCAHDQSFSQGKPSTYSFNMHNVPPNIKATAINMRTSEQNVHIRPVTTSQISEEKISLQSIYGLLLII